MYSISNKADWFNATLQSPLVVRFKGDEWLQGEHASYLADALVHAGIARVGDMVLPTPGATFRASAQAEEHGFGHLAATLGAFGLPGYCSARSKEVRLNPPLWLPGSPLLLWFLLLTLLCLSWLILCLLLLWGCNQQASLHM